jgi:hypothetical protein
MSHWAFTVYPLDAGLAEVMWMRVRIWGSDKRRAPLVIDVLVLVPRWGAIYLLPSEARRLIEGGRASDWDPLRRGPAVCIAPE